LNIAAIIPTYNRRQHVFRAIDSVLAQTMPVDEIIVVDDGSFDGTFEAIRAHYGARVVLIRQANSGVSSARARAMKEARYEWVAFLDSDDIWSPTKLERQQEALAALGSEFGACVTNCGYMGDPRAVLTKFEVAGFKTRSEFGELTRPAQYVFGKKHLICIPSLLARRSLINEVGGFDESLGLGEDTDLLFRLTFRTRFCYVSTALVTIDRTADLARLTNLHERKSDQTYAWLEASRKKMLAHPELKDNDIRQSIQEELLAIYYGRAQQSLRSLRFRQAIKMITKIRDMGHGYQRIIWRLLLHASSRLTCMSRNEQARSTRSFGDETRAENL
jgi:glycosyltransferase involved in cell wall biosynthesis